MKQLLTIAALLLLAFAPACAQFTINGLTVVYDQNTATYLCSIDKGDFGSDYTATIRVTNTAWSNLAINGTAVATGSKYTFASVEANKTYALTVNVSGTPTSAKIAFTYLPILQAKGSFSTTYTTGTLRVIEPDESEDSDMRAKIKCRGTTVEEGQKHNFHIKFISSTGSKKNRSFFGMRRDNSWLLNAARKDLSRVRNRVATDVWLDMASAPYYTGIDNYAKLGVRGVMVEMFVNNDYMGVYSFTEAMDRKQMGLQYYDTIATKIHGVLYKADDQTAQTLMTAGATFVNTIETQYGFTVKYPDLEDVADTGVTDFSVLSNAIDFVANSSDEEFAANVGSYFDLPVVTDYLILLQSLLAIDNDGKNIYWGCFDSSTDDKRFTLGVWDLDSSVGQSKDLSDPHSAAVAPATKLNLQNRLFARLKSLNPDGFYDNLVARYRALREGVLHADSLTARYNTAINDLLASGAAQRESTRWSGHEDIGGATLDFDSERDYIAQWLPEHLAYLDKVIDASDTVYGDVNGDGNVDVADLNILINIALGTIPMVEAADLNGDGEVDVQDINTMINLMMNN